MKKLEKNVLKLHEDRVLIENTVYGSLVSAILYGLGKKWTDGHYVNRFKRVQLPFLDDPDFLIKVVRAFNFNLEDVKKCTIALYQDEHNSIFWPVVPIKDEDGEYVLTPVPYRLLTRTVLHNIDSPQLVQW